MGPPVHLVFFYVVQNMSIFQQNYPKLLENWPLKIGRSLFVTPIFNDHFFGTYN